MLYFKQFIKIKNEVLKYNGKQQVNNTINKQSERYTDSADSYADNSSSHHILTTSNKINPTPLSNTSKFLNSQLQNKVSTNQYQTVKKSQAVTGQRVVKINKKRREIKPSNLLGGDYFMFLDAKRQGNLKMIKDCDDEVLYQIWQMQKKGIPISEMDFAGGETNQKQVGRQSHYNRRVNVQYLIGQNNFSKSGMEDSQNFSYSPSNNIITYHSNQFMALGQSIQPYYQNDQIMVVDEQDQNNHNNNNILEEKDLSNSVATINYPTEGKNMNNYRLIHTKDDFDKESIQKLFSVFVSPQNRPMSSSTVSKRIVYDSAGLPTVAGSQIVYDNVGPPAVAGNQIVAQSNQIRYMNNIQKNQQNQKNSIQKKLSYNFGSINNQLSESTQASTSFNQKGVIKNTPRIISRPISQYQQTGSGAQMITSAANNTQNENQNTNTNTNKFVRKSIKNTTYSPKNQVQTGKQLQILQKQENYRDFINLINYSNNLIVPYSLSNPTPPLYKVYIGLGNNGILVRQIFKSRWWWQLVESHDDWPDCQFLWMQWRRKEYTKYMKSLPQLSYDRQFQKQNEENSLPPATDQEVKAVAKKKPVIELSKKKGDSYQKLVQKLLNEQDFEDLEQHLINNKKLFTPPFISKECCSEKYGEEQSKNKTITKLKDPINYRLHNHIQNNYHICNKKALFYNMRQYYECLGKNPFDYIPLTFHIKEGINDKEWEKFTAHYNEIDSQIQENEKLKLKIETEKLNQEKPKILKNIWIIKPGEATNRGNGIQVASDLKTIQDIVNTKEVHNNGKNMTFIVQKYLEKPLLYNKRKFDIRCYMLITTYNGVIKGYWYQEGYIRTSSKEFTLRNLENKFIHLTNDAIQKKGEEFGKFEIGNKLSFNEFQRYMDTINGSNSSKYNFMEKTYQDMKTIATDCVKAIFKKIEPQKKQFSFELFGLDFMIDENYKTWLIEVNTNPCLETSCPLLSRIITTLIENVFKVAVDPIFPPPNFPKSKKHLVPDNIYESNKFELVFDEQYDSVNLEMLPSKIEEIQEEDYEEEEEQQQLADEE